MPYRDGTAGMKWLKDGKASANQRYGVMVAAWLAFGWPRMAFPADQIASGNAADQLLSASGEVGIATQPLSLKLSRVIGASPAGISAQAMAATENTTRLPLSPFGEGSGIAQPLRLKLTQAISISPANISAEAPFVAESAVKLPLAASGEGGSITQPLRLRLTQAISASPTKISAEAMVAAESAAKFPLAASGEDSSIVQPLRLRLSQSIGSSSSAAAGIEVVSKAATASKVDSSPRVYTTSAEAAAEPVAKRTSSLQFAPIDFVLGGSIGYDIQRQDIGTDKYMAQSINTNVNATVNTFIWQPWFARVNGGLGLGFNTTNMETGSANNTTSSKTSSNIVTGNATLALLPSSRFPFEARFNRSDSRQDSNLGAASSSYVATRYGLTQRYRPQTGGSNYMVSYDHDLWESASLDENRQDTFRAEMSQQYTNQTLRVSVDSTRNEQPRTNQSTLVNNLVSQHSYRPDAALSVESLANLVDSNYRLTQGGNDLNYMQLSSSAYWRPAEKPLNVNGGLRLFRLSSYNTTTATNTTKLNSINANVGATYEWSKHVRLNGSGNANMTDSNGSQAVSTNQSVGITYLPDAIPLGAFSYTRSVSSSVSNSTDPLGGSQHFTLSPSHGVNRKVGLGGGTLGMNLNQTVTFDVDTRSASNSVLTHMGSLSWSLSEGRRTTLVHMSANDSRAIGGSPYSFQLVNLQASLNESLSRNATWGGNLTAQVTRQGTETTPTSTTTTSSADLSYRHLRAFNVPRLRFTSELRIFGDALVPVLATPDQTETRSWENRLDYSIGRLQLRLGARVAEVNKITQTLYWFSANRQF